MKENPLMQVILNASEKARGPVIYPPDDREGEAPCLCVNDCVSAPMVFTGIFGASECSQIVELATRSPQLPGRMMHLQHHLISSRAACLTVRDETRWIYEKVWRIFNSVNRWYRYEIDGMVDEIQVATYGIDDGIDWHLDAGAGQTSTRKISLSLQLNEGSEYSGGDLDFAGHSGSQPARDRGTIVVFPSFLVHRVARVTQGIRFALVAWAHGPPFK